MDAIECLEAVKTDDVLDALYIKAGIIEIKVLKNKIKKLELLLKEAALVLGNEVRELSWCEACVDHINEELGIDE